MNNESKPPTPGGEIILYATEDGGQRIEVRLENETVWLKKQLSGNSG